MPAENAAKENNLNPRLDREKYKYNEESVKTGTIY